MFKEKVKGLLDSALEQRKDLFLLSLTVGANNHIRVVLDGDDGVNLKDCMDVSRAIEHNLDREEEDFSLEVTSAGATAPLTLPRQYTKNIGRSLEIRQGDYRIEGKLIAADSDTITLAWKAREPKPVGKGKHTVQKEEQFSISEIDEAKVVLKF
ncbi:ribosome assembly cofactor RimP [Flavobacterium sp. ASW18X]|uniref:ribosome assembly cofactor RimP n=1 Tax=Flavobacterium sp. ASW18X TaxID=2572595 RepID=UPI0010AEA764|nr:ribosome assembly cofactor RimP [Flavobacterium sp. ASW18X]TKD66617.1 ribosome assembly cofactor RimP [Flavobacterium sp. ASW18X]